MYICIRNKNTIIMKELFSLIAIKLVENKLSEESILVCGSILKESFVKEGFSRVLANEFAIDSIKIILKTLNKI